MAGWIDPVLVDFVLDAVTRAPEPGLEVLVLQVDSPGALVDDATMDEVVAAIEASPVPVAVWVGESGADARGEAGRLVTAADVAGMAPRARIEVGGQTYGPAAALDAGLVALNQEEAAVLGTFIAALDGKVVDGVALETADFTEQEDGPPVARLNVQTKLAKLDLWPRLMHSFASPPVAYLLLAAGLVLLVFELFTGGVGIAGGVGAGSLVLAAYGLAVLPTNPVGLGLIILGIFGFAVDVQTGVPRFWTGVGVLSFATGSVLLYTDGIRLGWLPLVAGVVGVLLMVLAGLPATVRSRYSTPTIGRESMVGEVGEAVADVRPDGVVRVRGALWPAHTSRVTPVLAGQTVRVVGIEGPRLQVEPAEE
ncbi:MAG TPA: NfeD family protein [Acidimicrobiales bacterium]|nr:NfeD family protein [Acidimicrobiales bacterium]